MRRNLKNSVLALLLVVTMVLGLTGNVTAAGTGSTNKSGLTWEEVEGTTNADVIADEIDGNLEDAFVSNEEVHVYVVLNGKSVVEAGYDVDGIANNKAAMKMSDKLVKEQNSMAKKISKKALMGEELDVKYNFTLLANAFTATVKGTQVEAIKEVSGVKDVIVMNELEPMAEEDVAEPNMGTAGPMVGATEVWNNGYTGAGQRLVVIDTGIDADHPSFDSEAFMYGLKETAQRENKSISAYNLLDKNEIKKVWDRLHVSAWEKDSDKAYLGEKIPFAFNYVDEDLDVTHDNDTQGEHGTHVSGITTANTYVKANGSYAKQAQGVAGVSPDAQLLTMKVFGKGGGAYTEDYMAAIEDALILNADCVNLSLGSSNAGVSKPENEWFLQVMQGLKGTDMVASISAGNAGRWADDSAYGANLWFDVNMDTVGSPGSYTDALTVASAVNCGYTGFAANFNGKVDVVYSDSANQYGCKDFNTLDTKGDGTTYDYVFITGFGEPSDFEGVDVKGKVVLVSRGTTSFFEKYNAAYDAGAAALIVYNNQAGTIGMNLTGKYDNADMPAVSITQADGLKIKETSTQSGNVYTGKITISSTEVTVPWADGYTMSDFSSYGTPGSLELKPEITAPGGNIWSTIDGGKYGLMSGTSMAAPSITGQTGLVMQYIKENGLDSKTGLCNRTLAQALMMSTATPLYQTEGVEYSPRSQGAGLANAALATQSPAYLLVGNKAGNDGKVKIELGDDPSKKGEYAFSFTINSLTDEDLVYGADASVLTEELVQNYFLTGKDYKLNPEVTFTASNYGNLYDITLDGVVDNADAEALATYIMKDTDCIVKNHEKDFDFNGDGKLDLSDVQKLREMIADGKIPYAESTDVIAVDGNGTTTVNVSIKLTDADRAYLAKFPSGMYVDAYVYLKGVNTLSLPMLAFYGNWADSSMFDPFEYLEYANNGDTFDPYNGVMANYLEYQLPGSAKKYAYSSNLFAKDDSYIADRNAIAAGGVVAAVDYTLIRNAARTIVSVTDASTGEVYYSQTEGYKYATYYYKAQSAWQNTVVKSSINWNGTDANGKVLPEGTKVNITVKSIPEYYDGIDADKVNGEGLCFTTPMTIDNTAPKATKIGAEKDGKIKVTVSDNRYVAAINVIDTDKETVLKTYAVNQTEAGKKKSVEIEALKQVFYVEVIDYAGNSKMYRVNNSGKADTKVIKSIALNKQSLVMIKGNQDKLVATCKPAQLTNDAVTWKSSNTSVVTVDKNGILKAVAAGKATITATSKAKNSKGKKLSATCTVEVKTIEVDLKGIVWDEEGSVFFSDFNTAKLPAYNKVSEKQNLRWISGTYLGDGKLMTATDEEESDLYIVDTKNNFEATKLNKARAEFYDMAYSKESGVVYSVYGGYMFLTDAKTGAEIELYNLSSKFGTMCGVAYVETSPFGSYGDADWLYVMNTDGVLYQVAMLPGIGYASGEVGATGVASKQNYNSLHYDATSGYIFWSQFGSTNTQTVYALEDTSTADTSSVACYELGQFPDGVWPISGLYQD